MADKTQGPVVYTALIMPLSSHASFPKPQPPGGGGGTQPPTGGGERPDNTLPGDIPRPEHPIYLPLPPGAPVDPDYGIDEGTGAPPRPDNTLPGQGSGGGERPTHPIVLPPGGSGGWLPVYIDNTLPGDMPHPDHELPQPEGGGAQVEWKAMWTPSTGWVSIAIVVPGEGANVPTPSKAKRK